MSRRMINGGCVAKAKALKEENGGQGIVVFVHRIGNERVDQTVYIPYPEDLGAIALNQRDNGYGTNMTVGVAIEYGEVIG